MAQVDTPSGDFAALEASGDRPGYTKLVGMGFGLARDSLAGVLVRLGVTPNCLTIAGFLVTLGAAACLAAGAGDTFGRPVLAGQGYWCLAAGALLFVAGGCDMLDGAVARIGGQSTPFGAVLDSSLDRVSDIVLYVAMVGHFAARGNLTYSVLAVVALANTFLISYVKARAEDLIEDCTVGWWQRGERHVALLTGAFSSHMPMMLWQQATLPLLTVLRRLNHARQVLQARQRGLPDPPKGPPAGRRRLLYPWRYPRGSIPFDILASVNLATVLFGPWLFPFFYGRSDPLRTLIDHLAR
jgi:CDP-diacylglycerol--glycerol-3-phosphate 3-phosphatidyltransferase